MSAEVNIKKKTCTVLSRVQQKKIKYFALVNFPLYRMPINWLNLKKDIRAVILSSMFIISIIYFKKYKKVKIINAYIKKVKIKTVRHQ